MVATCILCAMPCLAFESNLARWESPLGRSLTGEVGPPARSFELFRRKTDMRFRKFGGLGWDVSEIGLGTWALGSNWGPQDDSESVRTLHAALDAGCNFIDTARAYGDGRSERL